MSTDRYHPKKPCDGCPFLRAGEKVCRGLRPGRLEEIVESDGGFKCHQTVDETSEGSPTQELECAGFLIYHLINESAPNMMRIAGRMGMIDVDGLMEHADDVFDDFDHMVEAHESNER